MMSTTFSVVPTTIKVDHHIQIMQRNQEAPGEKNKTTGLILAGMTGGAGVILSIICAPFVSPALRRICLPYVPATTAQINNVLTALRGRSGAIVDLGSGDGRIVFSAAQVGFSPVDGVELNPWLVMYSRVQALRSGCFSKVSFYRRDLWKFNLSPYSNVIIFGVEEMMQELESKLISELRDGACIVACRFPLPTYKASATIGHGVDTVWLYQFPLVPSSP